MFQFNCAYQHLQKKIKNLKANFYFYFLKFKLKK